MKSLVFLVPEVSLAQFYFLFDGPGMSFVEGIVRPQASQTCCDNDILLLGLVKNVFFIGEIDFHGFPKLESFSPGVPLLKPVCMKSARYLNCTVFMSTN